MILSPFVITLTASIAGGLFMLKRTKKLPSIFSKVIISLLNGAKAAIISYVN